MLKTASVKLLFYYIIPPYVMLLVNNLLQNKMLNFFRHMLNFSMINSHYQFNTKQMMKRLFSIMIPILLFEVCISPDIIANNETNEK